MKTLKISLSIILLTITLSGFGQHETAPENPVLIDHMKLAYLESKSPEVLPEEIKENPKNLSHYDESSEILIISIPYAIDPPEMIFEPIQNIEEWMTTPFHLKENKEE